MDNKRKIGEEELKRALLMMKYDSRRTLTENVQNVSEQSTDIGLTTGSALGGAAAGAAATAGTMAWAGAPLGPVGIGIGAVVGAVAGGVMGYMNQTGTRENTLKIIESCKSGVGLPMMSDDAIKSVGTTIYKAIEGIGTDEEAISEAFDDLKTFPDFCRLTEIYENNYGESIADALDGDFDFPSDWLDYVYTPLRRILERTKVIDETKLSGSTTTDGGDTTGGGEVVPAPSIGNYKVCEGTYTKGCYSETIKKIQSCLGLVADGKFGPKTQAALESVGFANGFKDSDVDTICKAESMPEPDMDLPTPDDDIDTLN